MWSQDLPFRVAFGVLFFTLAAIVVRFRRAAQRGRQFDYAAEGRRMFVALRAGGLALWGYCLLYVVHPGALTWSFVAMPDGLRWMGAVVAAATVPLVTAAQRAIGRNVSPTVTTHDDHELVTTGPYRWVRHPLYTAGTAIFTGLGLLASSWFLLLSAAVALVLVTVRLPHEEARLEARFGQRYRDYAASTGRFLPRWF